MNHPPARPNTAPSSGPSTSFHHANDVSHVAAQLAHMPGGFLHMGMGAQWPGDMSTALTETTQQPPIPPFNPPIPVLTIYMKDYRNDTDNPEHYLAELRMPLIQEDDQWLVCADEMIRKLQSTPGRIDGSAKLFIQRGGPYKQLFCRLSSTGIEKCNPETLRLALDKSIEIIVESNLPPAPTHSHLTAVATNGPPIPPLTPSPSDDPVTSSPFTTQQSPGLASFPITTNKRQFSDEGPDVDHTLLSPAGPSKRSRTFSTSRDELDEGESSSQDGGFIRSDFAFEPIPLDEGNDSPTSLPHPSEQRIAKPSVAIRAASSSHSRWGGAITATETSRNTLPILRPIVPTAPIPSPSIANRSAKNQAANAAIVTWLRSQISLEDGYDAFVRSKGKVLSIAEALKCYRFAKNAIEMWNGVDAPEELLECAGRKITKLNIWQALDRRTSWGADAEMTLTLVEKYGPGAPEEHPKIVEMLNGRFAKDEREGAVLFLAHLKRIDGEKKASRDAIAAAAIAAAAANGRDGGLPSPTMINQHPQHHHPQHHPPGGGMY